MTEESFEALKSRCNARLSAEGGNICRKHKSHPEDEIQKNCVCWFKESFPELAPLLFHPNNEAFFGGAGKTEKQKRMAGQRAKEMGVTPGVADLILLVPAQGYHALMIEMKTKTGRQADSQKEWQKVVEAQGYKYTICRARIEFRTIIEDYLGRKAKSHDEVAVERLFGSKFKIHGQK